MTDAPAAPPDPAPCVIGRAIAGGSRRGPGDQAAPIPTAERMAGAVAA